MILIFDHRDKKKGVKKKKRYKLFIRFRKEAVEQDLERVQTDNLRVSRLCGHKSMERIGSESPPPSFTQFLQAEGKITPDKIKNSFYHLTPMI